ncbi:hypothetical protein ACFPAF_09955 [Hymenobacter endophyticus]|uniref:Lipoprotein n=1 Tax=Hymenobacter endophyticus TaxID=3076335 RepID=A0ABU3TH67_9BACT|nr:hypothetical protein [Hymenobacter endophyticus]MDU0370716.1 hypothetical protein [Hymenobacter endophyticus]
MKSSSLVQTVLAAGSLLLASCSLTPESVAPVSAKQSANNVAPYCPDGDCPSGGGGTGGGGYTPTCVAPTTTIRARIVREARLYAYGRSWEPTNVIVGTQGCDGVYPFSLEFRTQDGTESWVGGRYNVVTGEIDVDYINL